MNLISTNGVTLVADIGDSKVSLGFAGYSSPLRIYDSLAKEENGEYRFYPYGEFHGQTVPIAEDRLVNGDMLCQLIKQFMRETNTPEIDSILFSVPSSIQNVENYVMTLIPAILMFKTFCFVYDAVLAVYTYCKTSAIVIDFASKETRISPVIEGKIRSSDVKVFPYGFNSLIDILKEYLDQEGKQIYHMGHAVDYDSPIGRRIMADMIFHSGSFAPYNEYSSVDYYFDNEHSISVSSIAEDSCIKFFNQDPSIVALFYDSMTNIPTKTQNDLSNNVIVTGGMSSVQGIRFAITSQVMDQIKVANPICTDIPGYMEVWIGGSIFASSPVYDHLVIKKEDFESFGYEVCRVKFEF